MTKDAYLNGDTPEFAAIAAVAERHNVISAVLSETPATRASGHVELRRVFRAGERIDVAFPAEPLPLVLNIISKVLCFVAAVMLFVWRPDEEASARL